MHLNEPSFYNYCLISKEPTLLLVDEQPLLDFEAVHDLHNFRQPNSPL